MAPPHQAVSALSLILSLELGRGLPDRAYDGWVAAAAADVADQPVGDLFVARRWVRLEQSHGRNDLPGGAVAALGGGVLHEGFLHGMEHVAAGDALDRGNRPAIGFESQVVA